MLECHGKQWMRLYVFKYTKYTSFLDATCHLFVRWYRLETTAKPSSSGTRAERREEVGTALWHIPACPALLFGRFDLDIH